MFNHKNTPEDLVFYWDMDAPNIPNELPGCFSCRFVSPSALYEDQLRWMCLTAKV